MISSFRNFAKTKFAGILVFIMIIPFVFWGMGSMFSSGNTNTIAKINKTNISTEDFINYLNNSGIPKETIKKNLDNDIIEELLSSLISTTLLELEVQNYNLEITENILSKKIKTNKNFQDKNGKFKRQKYEKFLLENNQTAPQFETRLRKRELQKNLFDYIGAGSVAPIFLVNNLYEDENKEIVINFINLEGTYKKKEDFTKNDLKTFLSENNEKFKIEYLDFDYAVINPKNLIGMDEFNQSFFDKIDQIEIDISNEIDFDNIISKLNIKPTRVKNFKFSSSKNIVEKRIFELRKNRFDIFENNDNYILYTIKNISFKDPDLNDEQTKVEITNLLYQKNKFDYNTKLLTQIRNKKFNNDDFEKIGVNNIETIKLKSIKDNMKFEINAVEVLYSLPLNSFTLINDEEGNIYLSKIIKINKAITKEDNVNKYTNIQSSNIKNSMLKSYDLYLNSKYDVVLNQKTIERVKNFFK